MIHEHEVFDAVRRGYTEFENASSTDIIDYFESLDDESLIGHVSNIKGILFEQEYVDNLESQGITAELFGATNHPGTDVQMLGDNGDIVELQLKATDSVSYINDAIADDPETAFVVTSEVASQFDPNLIIDSGIENAALESAVSETLMDEAVNPVSPLSVIGWVLGIF
ncbi:hypothetical protein [Pseudidiomarina sp. YC-516-91]|uniref:hypothetical protein n=1 Tax=Pseudidiomarina salilacus TaxID=3384452 RepID=UPI00398464DE